MPTDTAAENQKGALVIKILLVNKFHYRKGGSETYYFALADLLRAAGHTVLFFAMQSEKNEPCPQEPFFVSNVEYNGPQSTAAQLKSAAKLLYSFEAKKKFAQLLKQEKPDVVHLNLVHRQITLSIVDVCKKMGVPVVFTQHDLICVCPNYTCLAPDGICEDCLSGHFGPCIKKGCVKGSKAKSILAAAEARLYRMLGTYNKIDCYITPSAFCKTMLEKGAFTKQSIVHLANFLPPDTQYQVFPAKNERLLYLGRLSAEKGPAVLLHALAQCPRAQADIAGDGPQYKELCQLAEELGVQDRVRFLGFVSDRALRDALESCKALVIPSECYENCPYSVMEALAAGKPVLGSRSGGIPELVQNGKTGYTFEPGDPAALANAITHLLDLPEDESIKMCQNAVDFAQHTFKAEHYLQQITALYEQLTTKNS